MRVISFLAGVGLGVEMKSFRYEKAWKPLNTLRSFQIPDVSEMFDRQQVCVFRWVTKWVFCVDTWAHSDAALSVCVLERQPPPDSFLCPATPLFMSGLKPSALTGSSKTCFPSQAPQTGQTMSPQSDCELLSKSAWGGYYFWGWGWQLQRWEGLLPTAVIQRKGTKRIIQYFRCNKSSSWYKENLD